MAGFNKEAEIISLRNKGLTDDKVINDLIEHKLNTPYTLKKRYPTETYDKINLMCRKYMDRLARFEVDYDFIIDEEKFKNTAICCLECAPFMHSQVINNPIAPYWRVADYYIDDMVIVKTVDDIDAAREEFFKIQIPLKSNMQMKIGLYYCEGKTYVLFIWNHMLFDGGGYKAFWGDFCKCYSDYVLNGISPLGFSSGSRRYSEVYKDMDKDKRKLAKKQLANVAPKDNHRMPFKSNEKTDNIIIVHREIGEEYLKKALSFAKENGATFNDILVTAFITALSKVAKLPEDDSIRISCATDLRRHMKSLDGIGYTNHVSFSHCYLENKGKNFKETLIKVSEKTNEFKNDPFMGLHGIPLLNFAYKSMTYIQAETLVRMFYNNPVLCVSNVGNVDKMGFEMANNSPFSAFVAGAAKNKPCAVMTALTVKGRLKASMCLRGNDDDKEVLEEFFTEFKNAIESI